jgi:AraC-like DNA-binding protein
MATISRHHVDASLLGCLQRGIDTESLLTRAGIRANPSRSQRAGRVHTHQVGRLFRIIQQELNDEFMGFTQNPSKFGIFATLCDLASKCQNLGELLQQSANFYNLLGNDVAMKLKTDGENAEFSITLSHPELDQQHFIAEFLMVIWHRFPSWYLGEAIRLKETHFAHPAPAHESELKVMFPGKLCFKQTTNKLIFDSYYLRKPLRRNSKEMAAFLHNYPIEIMTIPGEDSSLEALAERSIVKTLAGKLNFLSAEQLADELGLGNLTLYRRLQYEGTSYQRIKDNIRREKAIELLIERDISVDQISDVLGYSEPRSFTRAFRKWMGVSPRQYRTLNQNAASIDGAYER